MLTLLYASDSFIRLYEGSDPTVSQNIIQDYYTSENELNLVNDTNFRLAFGWRPYGNEYDNALKFDRTMMKWVVRITQMDKKGAKTSKNLDTHQCT